MEKARQILNSADIAHATQSELYKVIDKLATLDDDNLSADVKRFPLEQIRSALLDYKEQLNRKNLDSKGTTSSRQVLNSDLTDEQIDRTERIVNGEEVEEDNNSEFELSEDDERNLELLAMGAGYYIGEKLHNKKKSHINNAIVKEMGIAEDLGFDELENLENKNIYREKLANYEYYTEEGEEDL